MALVYHNIRLEYASNTLRFKHLDNDGVIEPFTSDTKLKIKRVDGSTEYVLDATISAEGEAVFIVNPPLTLWKEEDTSMDVDSEIFEHTYAIYNSKMVYIVGYVKLLRVV